MLIFDCKGKAGIEKEIIVRLKNDAPHFAHLEAVYSVIFLNTKENIVASDDIYYRKDLAKVYYGYSLDETVIHVSEDKDGKTLNVRLPMPERISVDRRTIDMETTHEGYQPREGGRKINVDAEMNRNMLEIVERYEEKTVERTKELSRQYFRALSERYGMKLDLEFVPVAARIQT